MSFWKLGGWSAKEKALARDDKRPFALADGWVRVKEAEEREDMRAIEAARKMWRGLAGALAAALLLAQAPVRAEAPGAESRRFPIVLDEADIVLQWIDPDRLERAEIEGLEVRRARL
ncbi:MAG: hypothetical protein QOC65_672, partial [Sphingomonadales bacterium]|nr:hypothetical protein [Sphingomonadales bacterium]